VTPPTTPDLDGAPEATSETGAAPETATEAPSEAVPGDDGGHGDDGGGEDEVLAPEGPGGLSWAKVGILGVALVFLGFAVGTFVNRDQPPDAGSVDVGFLQDMLTHHEQALGVSALTVAYGEDATVRSYAREVLTAQAYEQGRMTQMLSDWGFSRSDRPDTSMAWMDMEVPLEQMPGLLSDEQMDELSTARGAEMDALFLELMSEHHLGGVHMAEYAATEADDEQVREMANRMAYAQAAEINEYRHTADELGFDIAIPTIDIPPVDLPGDD
jgi:uncharacterized protein (DUF305 family)